MKAFKFIVIKPPSLLKPKIETISNLIADIFNSFFPLIFQKKASNVAYTRAHTIWYLAAPACVVLGAVGAAGIFHITEIISETYR